MPDDELLSRLEKLLSDVGRDRFLASLSGGLPEVPSRDELPTASEDFAYRLIVVRGTPDIEYVCLRDSGGSWGWRPRLIAGDLSPSDADYLVGTANSGLSAEIVVGTTPGGELGGTWASPTVDTVHSGSAHQSGGELWLLPHNFSGTYVSRSSYHTALQVTSAQAAYFSGSIPSAFTSLTSAEVIIMPDTTETINWQADALWSAVGENYTTGSDSIGATDKSVTQLILTAVDVAACFDGIAADDFFGLTFASNTDNLYVMGLRMVYA